jgi:anti-sigma-K factor RskA
MTDSTARQILLSGTSPGSDGALPEGRVIYAADKGALIFLANNLGPIQPDKVYELWLIPENGQDPIPAGTFHSDTSGNGRVILPPLPRAIHAKAFGVTVEDGNGSQTPTMPIVLAGS